MEIRQIWSVCWSATGTTQTVTNRIGEQLSRLLGRSLIHRSFTLPAERTQELCFGPGDLVIFGTPTYAGRVPNVLLPYLREHVHGTGALAVPVVLFGNRNYDDALIELRNLLEDGGLRTVAAGAFVGEHSFSKTLAAGRPDGADLELADRFAGIIADKVKTLTELPEKAVAVKGETPLRPYYTPRDREGNPVDIRKVRPAVSPACDSCGVCAKLCPMGSIDPEDVRRYTGICIKCGACIKGCPRGARYIDDAAYLYHKQELELGYARRAEPELFV